MYSLLYYIRERTSDHYYAHRWVWGSMLLLTEWTGWLYELHSWLEHWFLKFTRDYSQSQKLVGNKIQFIFCGSGPHVPCSDHFQQRNWTKTKETTMILLAAVTYWPYTMCEALSYRHRSCLCFHSQTFFLFLSNRKVIPRILQCSPSRSLLCIKNYPNSVGEVYITHNLPQDMVWTGKIHAFEKDHNRQRMCIQECSLHHYLCKQKKKSKIIIKEETG